MMESTERTHDGLSAFVAVRPRLFGIAYRMLGSDSDAEDVVQDAWLRWQTTDRSVVRSAPAFLTTMTTRLAINVAQSARSRHETSPEPWLPEPADASRDPGLEVERSEALERAVTILIEKLRPRERAVYVLSEAFDYSYAQIAEMLQLTEAHARQLASRARKFLGGERRQAVNAEEHRRLLDAFLAAASANDRAELEQLLVSEAFGDSDGGVPLRTAARSTQPASVGSSGRPRRMDTKVSPIPSSHRWRAADLASCGGERIHRFQWLCSSQSQKKGHVIRAPAGGDRNDNRDS